MKKLSAKLSDQVTTFKKGRRRVDLSMTSTDTA